MLSTSDVDMLQRAVYDHCWCPNSSDTGIGFRIAHPGGPSVLPHRREHQEQGPAKSPSHNRHLRGGSLLARALIERKEARRV
jgi:hypothetical protein